MFDQQFACAEQGILQNYIWLSLLCLVLAPTFFSALRTLQRRQALAVKLQKPLKAFESLSKEPQEAHLRGSQRHLRALLHCGGLLWRARVALRGASHRLFAQRHGY